MKNSSHRKKSLIPLVAVFFMMCALSAAVVFVINKYGVDMVVEKIKSFTDSLGILGVIFMLFVQILQVILAFIPGEPIEIAAGALYGTVGGAVLCLVGIAVGTFVIFLTVKLLGKELVMKVIGSDKYAKLKFLQKPSKRDIFIFLLMFIPGTPKDVLTYFSPLTGINMTRFLLIAAIARIPSVISSTYVGDTLAEGNYLHSAIVFVIVGAVSITGILIYNKIIETKNKGKEAVSDGK